MPKIRVKAVRDIHMSFITSSFLITKNKSESNFLNYISKYSPVHAIVIKKKNIAKKLLISKSFFLYIFNISKLEYISLLWRIIDIKEFGSSYLTSSKTINIYNEIDLLTKILRFFNYMGWRKFGIEIINFHFLKNKNYDYLLSQNFQNKIKKKQLNDLLTVCVFFFYKHNLFSISKKITLLRIKEIEKEFGKNHINTIKINIRLANIYLNNSDLDHDKLIKAKHIYEDNLKILKKIYSYKRFYLIKVLFDYTKVLRRLNENDKAKKIIYLLIKKVHQNFGHNHEIILDFKLQLAKLFGKEDIKKSVEILNEIIPKQEQKFGLLSDHVFESKNSLALRYRNLNNIPYSSKLFLELENTATKKYGPEHLTTLRMSKQLAKNYTLEGDFPKAEKIYKKMLNVYEKKFNLMHPILMEPLMELGIIYKKMKNNKMLKKISERILTIKNHSKLLT